MRSRLGYEGYWLAADFGLVALVGLTALTAWRGLDALWLAAAWMTGCALAVWLAGHLANRPPSGVAELAASRFDSPSLQRGLRFSAMAVAVLFIGALIGTGAWLLLGLRAMSRPWPMLAMALLIGVACLRSSWIRLAGAASVLPLLGMTLWAAEHVVAWFGYQWTPFAAALRAVTYEEQGVEYVRNFLQGGLLFRPPYELQNIPSLFLAVALGLPALPQTLYGLGQAKPGRRARLEALMGWAMAAMWCGAVVLLGFGAAAILRHDAIEAAGGESSALALLLATVAGDRNWWIHVLALVVCVALAVRVLDRFPPLSLRLALLIGGLVVAVGMPGNPLWLIALAMAVAASTLLPVAWLTVKWQRLTTKGATASVWSGLLVSIGLIVLGPLVSRSTRGFIELENPALISVPLAFLMARWVSRKTR